MSGRCHRLATLTSKGYTCANIINGDDMATGMDNADGTLDIGQCRLRIAHWTLDNVDCASAIGLFSTCGNEPPGGPGGRRQRQC